MTLLVVVVLVGLAVLLLGALVQFAGYLGIVLGAGLLVGLVLLAAVAGVSLEAAFGLVAYAVGATRSVVTRVGKRFGR